ncbi:MAG: dihydropteroate synthase [Pseudomonadales bacterium]|nr:dihydropteroate synthase [Pseudomonadales bacterium]MDG1442356.1 dihydropteroate synthase [Pseudomonadales bacterium]
MIFGSAPLIMGILNVTPDSFSDGGDFSNVDDALEHAFEMVEQGVDLIDIGGESTRPGAAVVSIDEELARVTPVIEALRRRVDIPLSIDTSAPEVMTQAAAMGVSLINDVRGLRRAGALQAAQKTGLPVCLMHMQGDPETMQLDPHYQNLIEDVKDFFAERIQACEQAGLAKERLILDPGFGFGKSPTDNLTLINRLAEFKSFELPILVGLSRKSTMSKLLEQQNFNPSQQEADIIEASVAGALLAIERGASIVRVHDVKQTVIALKVRQAIKLESVF